jgi:hypothetical protein
MVLVLLAIFHARLHPDSVVSHDNSEQNDQAHDYMNRKGRFRYSMMRD